MRNRSRSVAFRSRRLSGGAGAVPAGALQMLQGGYITLLQGGYLETL